MTTLEGKVAIVTGGTGGIGRGVAVRLAERGATVVVNGRSEEKARRVLEEVSAAGGRGRFIAGDVRSQAEMEALVAGTAEAYGGVDIVIPNAGGNDNEARSTAVRGPFPEIDLARVTAWVAESLTAKLLVVQAAIPQMRLRGRGSVVFVTSEGGRVPTRGQTAVSAFSAGLIQTSKLLSKELAREQIRVNTVCVTIVRDSPAWEAVFEREGAVSDHHRRQYQKVVDRAPLGVADPFDIGNVVSFLASDESDYLTGAILSPTGGLTLH